MNKALTAADLAELQRMLADSGVGAADDIRRAAEQAHGLGLFVRSLVGLDRQAAKEALAGFLNGKALSANQIEFVNLIVDHLTEHGVMEAAMLYESPFTDLTPRGPEELFTSVQIDELLAAIEQVRQSGTGWALCPPAICAQSRALVIGARPAYGLDCQCPDRDDPSWIVTH